MAAWAPASERDPRAPDDADGPALTPRGADETPARAALDPDPAEDEDFKLLRLWEDMVPAGTRSARPCDRSDTVF
jgi:hypothetical protein